MLKYIYHVYANMPINFHDMKKVKGSDLAEK